MQAKRRVQHGYDEAAWRRASLPAGQTNAGRFLNKVSAAAIAEKSRDAYSADRYASWQAVAALLLARGYDATEAEAIMRSKWTRWAADVNGAAYGKVPAKAVGDFLDDMAKRPKRHGIKTSVADAVIALVAETFGGPEA